MLQNGSEKRAKLVNKFNFLLEKKNGSGDVWEGRGGEGEGVPPPPLPLTL